MPTNMDPFLDARLANTTEITTKSKSACHTVQNVEGEQSKQWNKMKKTKRGNYLGFST